MTKIITLASFLFLIISCEEKSKTDLNDNLYNVLIDYQKKFPLKEIPEHSKYVYEVYFYQDSTVSISLSPIGVNLEEKKPYGIYKDKNLKATYVIDDNKLGKNLIKNYIQKDLDKYIMKNFVINDAIYPEYIFKIKGKKLVFSDSIRGNIRP
ncbi:hypothetical protein [Chryseobacterium salviniae]|uniref:Beta-lactamase-inhibitor-like, PepSY-like n=1 Tax=Chryseobacterium salviniae TaxID=3101750 RepID=A0ABU6HVH2_9FLAO|nr:hypothetical protein [Chryseobacterium sp. T9W2-O]MEC3876689.1 hypothetical protein [Chryseobacterium sp. T9W2-O]